MKKTSPKRVAKLASTRQQLPDLSSINITEFNVINFIKSQHSSKTSFRDLYYPITRVIERLKFFNSDQIKEMYDEKKRYQFLHLMIYIMSYL